MSSTRIYPRGSKPSSTASPKSRTIGSRQPPRLPTCWNKGSPTFSSRQPFRRPSVPGVTGPSFPSLEFDVPASKVSRRSRRRLAVAASVVLLALAGLGASEAAGLSQVTDFVATILRIKTPEGTAGRQGR